jgi:hypothetical protein
MRMKRMVVILLLLMTSAALFPLVVFAQEAYLSDGVNATAGTDNPGDIYLFQTEASSSPGVSSNLTASTSADTDEGPGALTDFLGWFGKLF